MLSLKQDRKRPSQLNWPIIRRKPCERVNDDKIVTDWEGFNELTSVSLGQDSMLFIEHLQQNYFLSIKIRSATTVHLVNLNMSADSIVCGQFQLVDAQMKIFRPSGGLEEILLSSLPTPKPRDVKKSFLFSWGRAKEGAKAKEKEKEKQKEKEREKENSMSI